jgi:hypothetical protein
VIPHGHALTADAAKNQTLQQRRTLSRRTLATIISVRLSILTQKPLIVFVLFPRDISCVNATRKTEAYCQYNYAAIRIHVNHIIAVIC